MSELLDQRHHVSAGFMGEGRFERTHLPPVAAPDLDRPTAGHEARELDQWIIASLFWAATKVDDAATGTLST